MRKSEQTKARERVLYALPNLPDADLWYIIGACNGLIQARRQASEKARNDKPIESIATYGVNDAKQD